MALADKLQQHKIRLPGPPCTVCTLVQSLSAKDRAVLNAALVDGTFTSAAITRALRDEGHAVTATAVSRHRKSECRRSDAAQ